MADPNPDSESGLSLPADNGLLWLFELRIRKNGLPSRSLAFSRKPVFALRAAMRQPLPRREAPGEGWWEVLVMLQSSLPTVILRHRIYRPAAGTAEFGVRNAE